MPNPWVTPLLIGYTGARFLDGSGITNLIDMREYLECCAELFRTHVFVQSFISRSCSGPDSRREAGLPINILYPQHILTTQKIYIQTLSENCQNRGDMAIYTVN